LQSTLRFANQTKKLKQVQQKQCNGARQRIAQISNNTIQSNTTMPPKNQNNGKAPPFTAKSEEYKQLAQMFETGEIDKHWSPKMVWDTYPVFQKYPLGAFRAQMYKYKTMNGIMVDEKDAPGGKGCSWW
jgi:hypothetical protein